MRKLLSLSPLFFVLLCSVCVLPLGVRKGLCFDSSVQVGIYYYSWYNVSDPQFWEYPKVCDKSVLGYYDSDNVSVITQHFRWMEDLHIDFVMLSWFGQYDEWWYSYVNNTVHHVFQYAKENVTNLKFCILLEPFNKSESATYNYQEIYDYIYDNFVVPYPTVYYNYVYKPLLVFFNDVYLTPNGDVPLDDRFTMVISGGSSYVDWFYTSDLFYYWVYKPYPRCDAIDVIPCFDNSRFGFESPPPEIADMYLTEGLYEKQWNRALKCVRDGSVHLITITSWNEFAERTAIEPHWDATGWNHDPYYLYNLTRDFMLELRGLESSSSGVWYQNPVVFGVIALGICLGVVLLWKS